MSALDKAIDAVFPSDGHDSTEFRDEIKCPSCGKIDWEHTDYPPSLERDGDKVETECGYCCKPMRVTLCVEYTYATEKVKDRT